MNPEDLLFALGTSESGKGSWSRSKADKIGGPRTNTRSSTGSSHLDNSPYLNRDTTIDHASLPDASSEIPPFSFPAPTWDTTGFSNHAIGFIKSSLRSLASSPPLPQVRKILREMQNFTLNPENPRLPPKLYERLITAYLNLRYPAGAVDAYNAFIRAGHEPTVSTYTILMRGAAKGRDLNALQAFWTRMGKAGFKADAHAWSILIFGLIRAGKIEDGLGAVEMMGRQWKEAAEALVKGSNEQTPGKKRKIGLPDLLARFPEPVLSDGTPKPTIAIVNTAIAALASRKSSMIPRVLGWGREFALEPDRITYNYLLNMAMQSGKKEEAFNILNVMKAKGIGTNAGTWTIVMHSWFESGGLMGLSEEEVGQRVFGFLDSISDKSTPVLDEKGYAILINAFLKYHGSSLLTQRAIEHMLTSGLEPTTHIYTMLATYFFQNPGRTEPNPGFGRTISGPNLPEGVAVTDAMVLDGRLHSALDSNSSDGMEAAFKPGVNLMPPLKRQETAVGMIIPDYVSLAALWTHLMSRRSTAGNTLILDSVFFDRLIEGYAKNHRTSPDPMQPPPTPHKIPSSPSVDVKAPQLGFPMVWPALRLMTALGLQPSWRALEALIQALAERGQWVDFERVVEQARRRVVIAQTSDGSSRRFHAIDASSSTMDHGVSEAIPTSAFGQRSFWEFVIDTGYLKNEGIVRAEDIMLAQQTRSTGDIGGSGSRLADLAATEGQ